MNYDFETELKMVSIEPIIPVCLQEIASYSKP